MELGVYTRCNVTRTVFIDVLHMKLMHWVCIIMQTILFISMTYTSLASPGKYLLFTPIVCPMRFITAVNLYSDPGHTQQSKGWPSYMKTMQAAST